MIGTARAAVNRATPRSAGFGLSATVRGMPLPPRVRPVVLGASWLAAGCVATGALWLLGGRLLYEATAPTCWDCHLYWAVGRGITNGLIPYRDLFETKPPGVFLFAAASYALTGGKTLGAAAVTAAAAVVGFGPAAWAWYRRRDLAALPRAFFAVMGLVLGTLLVLYAGERVGWEFQTEGLGAGAGVLAVLATAGTEGRTRWIGTGALLFLASFLKEPLLFSTGAALLLVTPAPRAALRTVILPGLLAAALWLLALIATRTLEPYVSTYLPELLSHRIAGTEPVWARALSVPRFLQTARDIAAFSAPLLWALAILLTAHLALRLRAAASWGKRTWIIATALAALSGTTFAVHLGGGALFNHHFVAALPLYVALFCGATLVVPVRGAWGWILAPATLLLLLSLWDRQPITVAERVRANRAETATAEEAARATDAVLDRCGTGRYLFAGPNGAHPFGYTRHSPLGPLFYQYGYYLDDSRPAFQAAFLRAVDEANVAVIWSPAPEYGALADEVRRRLAAHFSTEAWPCAGDARMPEPYLLLFRKKGPSGRDTL